MLVQSPTMWSTMWACGQVANANPFDRLGDIHSLCSFSPPITWACGLVALVRGYGFSPLQLTSARLENPKRISQNAEDTRFESGQANFFFFLFREIFIII